MGGRRGSARAVGGLLALTLILAACAPDGGGELASDDPVGVAQAEAPTTTGPAPTSPSSTTSTSLPPGGRQPDADDPLRVLFAGDSIGIEVAAPAMAALGGGGSVVNFFVANTALPRGEGRRGLWETRLERSDPEVIVLLVGVWERMVFGGDKLAGMTVTQYRTQVLDPFVDLVTSAGARVVWVSAPRVRDRAASDQIAFLDEAFRSVGESDDRVDYVDAASRLDGPNGEFIDVVTGPDGFAERVRRLDGTHLCPGGAVRMAEPVVDFIAEDWNVPVDPRWPNGAWRAAVPFEKAPVECPAVG